MVRLRRTSAQVDLRGLALDGVDTFLLSRVEQALTLEELTDVMPCPANETALRVGRLLEAGLIQPADESGLFDDDSWQDFAELPLVDAELQLPDDDWDGLLPFPEPDFRLEELEEAAAQAALFAAEPPSTLISLFQRVPLQVQIHTLGPSPTAPQVTEGSNVFRRPTAPNAESSEEEMRNARKRK